MIGLNDVLTGQNLPGVLQAFLSRDPDIGFNFMVMIDAVPVGDFAEVETIEFTIDPFVYRELGKNDGPHHLLGEKTPSHVVLKWGLMNRSTLYDWMAETALDGEGETSMLSAATAMVAGMFGDTTITFKKTVIVTQFTRGKIPIRIYTFNDAWPVRWKGASLNSDNSQTALEEVELAYSSMTMTAIPLPF